jgi:hypothetical protein
MQWGDMTLTGLTSENNGVADFSIYPNPFNDATTIDLSNFMHNDITIEIYNTLGKLVRKIDNINQKHYTLSCNNITAGIYIVKVLDKKNNCKVKRMVVN